MSARNSGIKVCSVLIEGDCEHSETQLEGMFENQLSAITCISADCSTIRARVYACLMITVAGFI